MMAGNVSQAGEGFADLSAQSEDSLLRNAARIAYSAALQYEENWRLLASLPSSSVAGGADDRAAVKRWASSFASIGPKVFEFPRHSVVEPLSFSYAGTPMVPVRINGHDYHFWLDTGSSMTIIPSDVAAVLGVVPVSADTLEIVTNTGRVAALPTVLDRIEIGELVIKNATAMIVDEGLMELRERPRLETGERTKIYGIIGFDIIHRLDIEIDHDQSRIRIRNPSPTAIASLAGRNFFWLGIPVVALAAADGTPLNFGLDTGAELTFGTKTLMDKLTLRANRRDVRRVGGLGRATALQTGIVHELRVKVRDRPFFLREMIIYPPVYRTLVSLDGILGADVTRAGVVRLDATNGIFSINAGATGERRPVN